MRINLKYIAAMALLLMPSCAFGQFSKSTMNSQTGTSFPDNITGAITPATTRTYLNNLIASYQQAPTVNAQTGASYTFAATDYGTLVTFNNGGAVAVTLPQAAGSFNPFNVLVANLGAGLVTITPQTSTINGGATLGVKQNGFVLIVSDGTNYQTFGIPGALAAALFPALTGDVTTSAGSLSTTIANNAVTNAKAAQMAANGLKGNNTGGASNVLDLTPGQAGAILCVPNIQIFTSGSAQTYTTPTCNSVTATWVEVHVQGGGGGGGSSGSAANNNGTAGNTSSFGALTANGGGSGGGGAAAGGAGGACSGSLGTQQNFPGSAGFGVATTTANSLPGGAGGVSFYGGYGAPALTGVAGGSAPANSGGGGAGGSGNATAGVNVGSGGGAGCHIWSIITSPAATYTYTVGGTAAHGNAGTNGLAGGDGAAGLITAVAHWQ